MLFPINNVGQIGVVADKEAQELPPNVWSFCQNIHFTNGYAEKLFGHFSVFGTPGVAPQFSLNVANDTSNMWMYASLDKIYCWDGGAHTNITRQTAGVDVEYSATESQGWNGGVLSGIPVINNGVDAPQMWNPPTAGTKCAALSNWPANTTCSSLKPFKQFLIAMDVTKSGTRYPYLVKWSHPADPGSLPGSWDETDPTKLAGESPKLSETPGFLVDGEALRDTFILYKEDSVWGMQILNTTEVFRIYKIFSTGGIISTNCAVEFFNGKHAVFGISDIYQHDGQNMVSIVDEKVRLKIYGTIEGTQYRKCHVAHDAKAKEVLFCYPTTGHTDCNEALVWNYASNTVGFRTLPNTTHIAVGIVNPTSTVTASDQWDTDTQTWDDDTSLWGERLYNPIQGALLASSPSTTKLELLNQSTTENGVAMEVILERRGIGLPLRSQLPPDMSYRKFCRAIWARITGTPGHVVYVSLGTQDTSFDSVVWGPEVAYTIGTSQKVDVRESGRLLAVRFRSQDALEWRLHGYELEYEPMGRF